MGGLAPVDMSMIMPKTGLAVNIPHMVGGVNLKLVLPQTKMTMEGEHPASYELQTSAQQDMLLPPLLLAMLVILAMLLPPLLLAMLVMLDMLLLLLPLLLLPQLLPNLQSLKTPLEMATTNTF